MFVDAHARRRPTATCSSITVQPFRGEDLGTLDAYKPLFEPRNHEYGRGQPCLYGLDSATCSARRSRRRDVAGAVEPYLDVLAFITLIAAENFLAENDGILGYAGMNNFYMYRFDGHDAAAASCRGTRTIRSCRSTSRSLSRLDDNVLSRRLLGSTIFARSISTRSTSLRTRGGRRRLARERNRPLGRAHRRCRASDTRKLFSNDDFDAGVDFLNEFAALRPGFVAAAVAAAR